MGVGGSGVLRYIPDHGGKREEYSRMGGDCYILECGVGLLLNNNSVPFFSYLKKKVTLLECFFCALNDILFLEWGKE